MLRIHPTYNKERLEKLSGMFHGDPLQGNVALYVREHFDLKRICERCGRRTTANRLAVASVIVEGPAWVLPLSLRHDGGVEVDLESSIPAQSNFLSEHIIEAIDELGITPTGKAIEHVIPIMADRDAHFRTIPDADYRTYQEVQRRFTCRVIANASPDQVLNWDTEVEYDYEAYWEANGDECVSGYNVQSEYFEWLAEHGQLVIARISDQNDVTLGLAYCVPERYQLYLMRYKWRLAAPQRESEVVSALFFMLIEHIYENRLTTPLNVGPVLDAYMDIWRPIPVGRQRLEISNRVSRHALLDCFGSK